MQNQEFSTVVGAFIELDSDISIFVGSNNSGNTSATQAIHAFVAGTKDRFSVYDFSSACWKIFDETGDSDADGSAGLPTISLDLWFEVSTNELHLVIPLLPSTAWSGTEVGIRIEFAATNPVELLTTFRTIRVDALAKAAALEQRQNENYVPWPRSLMDLRKHHPNMISSRSGS
ncbi:hypothetical protein PMN64_34330 [Bradyrhizobium sp. UFLA01-814]|uniref:hypothetical protein n=1 Tax=Bradyrhizobium sp. UFLA01-814 TaxID=3023480 RepID=UPI00398B32E0